MRLARKEIIRACEKQMIRAIVKNIDPAALKEAVREQYDLGPADGITFEKGDLAVKNGQIVYRLDFSMRVGLTVTLDRDGRCLGIGAPEKQPPEPEEAEADPRGEETERNRRVAAEIAQMISEINQ